MKSFKELMEEIRTIMEVNLKTSDFVSGMKKEGWVKSRQRGEHEVWTHELHDKHITIPKSRTLSIGVYSKELNKRKDVIKKKGMSV